MKLKTLISLSAASVGAFGLLSHSKPANAANFIAPGSIQLVTETNTYISGNAIDFTSVEFPNAPTDPSGGFAGAGFFDVTSVSGAFFDVDQDGNPDTADTPRAFFGPGSDGVISDLFVDAAALAATGRTNANGGFLTGETYTISELTGGALTSLEILRFDNDFTYEITALTRRVAAGTNGGFDASFDFEGFFVDQLGEYENTPSIISIFNGTLDVNPDSLGVTTVAEFIEAGNPNVTNVAAIDATITTAAAVPEPASILGLFGVVGCSAGFLRKKQS